MRGFPIGFKKVAGLRGFSPQGFIHIGPVTEGQCSARCNSHILPP
ncbi:MAG: Uncharacterised protein [Halieaceae bacterium]|nr:MAG: Uncharacterised protein [Halieaceae bacterium]